MKQFLLTSNEPSECGRHKVDSHPAWWLERIKRLFHIKQIRHQRRISRGACGLLSCHFPSGTLHSFFIYSVPSLLVSSRCHNKIYHRLDGFKNSSRSWRFKIKVLADLSSWWGFYSWLTDRHLLTVSSYGREREREKGPWCLFFHGHWAHPEGSILMTASKPNYQCSQRPQLLIPSHGGKGLNRWILREHNPVHSIPPLTLQNSSSSHMQNTFILLKTTQKP